MTTSVTVVGGGLAGCEAALRLATSGHRVRLVEMRPVRSTDAHQSDKNLLLSTRAEVDSKPSLLIYADDVNCGHGATAGHIDDSSLFYMRSRGLDPETARGMLIRAFAREIIDPVKPEPLRDHLEAVILNTIPSLGGPLGGGK